LSSLFATIACFKLPESARFEVANGNTKNAIRILKKIAIVNKIPMPEGTLTQRPAVTR